MTQLMTGRLPILAALLLGASVPLLLAAGGGGGGDKEADHGGGDKGGDDHGGGDKDKGGDDHGGGDKDDGVHVVNPHDGELPPLPWDVAREGEDGCDDEEILILRELRHRKTVLDRRAVELEERITAAEVLEAQLAVKLSQLQVTRTEILVALHEQQRLQEVLAASGEALPGDADEGGTVLEADQAERVQSLARMVEAMKPRAAGPMLAGMDPDVALMVLQLLKPKQAGKVLAAMPAGVAQQLGDRMTARNPGASAAADRVESTPAPAEPAPQTGEEEGS